MRCVNLQGTIRAIRGEQKNACNTNVTYMTFYHNIPPVPLRPIK